MKLHIAVVYLAVFSWAGTLHKILIINPMAYSLTYYVATIST